MTIEHSIIADPNIHEPKGVAVATSGKVYVANGTGSGTWALANPKGSDTATLGQVYVSDGAGAGTWEKVQKAQAACMKFLSIATTLMSTAFQAINTAVLGGTITFTQNTAVGGLTTDTTSGYIAVVEAGVYNIAFVASILPSTINSVFSFTIGVDSGAGIVEKSANVMAITKTSGTTDTTQVSMQCLPTLLAGDKVYLMVKEAAGNEIKFESANFVLIRVA